MKAKLLKKLRKRFVIQQRNKEYRVIDYLEKSGGFLKTFISPFKPLKIKLYLGKIRYGTPYFFPRRFMKDPNNPGYLKPIPKKFGFDFVGLGYKTKWSRTDYRFEWEPIWSFVFFGFQIALIFRAPHPEHYWVCWLT